MEIHVIHGEAAYLVPVNVEFSPRLPRDEKLIIGVNVNEKGVKLLPPEHHYCHSEEWGMKFTLGLPSWLHIPESTKSRSCSHARYVAEGDICLDGMNIGVLLQVLPAGRETSCHSHPDTDEYFVPVLRNGNPTPILYSPGRVQPIPAEGYLVEAGTCHQLQAPPAASTVTLIFMWPIPYVTWMGGHQSHSPPFVPYT